MCRERAFTLIQLIITIAIASTLLLAAIPSLTRMAEANQLAAQINRLRAGLELARNHAVTARVRTVVCKASTDLTGCATNGDWSDGWWVFEDKLNDNQCVDTNSDGSCDNGGGRILLKAAGITAGFRLSASGNLAYRVVYDQTGTAPGYLGTFSLCSLTTPGQGSGLKLMATGRVRVAAASTLSCND